jgi:hypothetical protein
MPDERDTWDLTFAGLAQWFESNSPMGAAALEMLAEPELPDSDVTFGKEDLLMWASLVVVLVGLLNQARPGETTEETVKYVESVLNSHGQTPLLGVLKPAGQKPGAA